MVVCAVSRAEETPNAVPGLSHEAEKRMIALSSPLLRVVSTPCPVLAAEHRNDVRVYIQGDFAHAPESLADVAHEYLIDPCQVLRLVDSDFPQKTAHSALGGQAPEMDDLLKYLVRNQFYHMAGPENPHHQSVEHGQTHVRRRVVIFSAFFGPEDCHQVRNRKFVKDAAPARRPRSG